MTTQPDPAAVRCVEHMDDPFDHTPTTAEIITRECALTEGRALAEAVLDAWTQTHKCDVRDIDERTHIDRDDWAKIETLARAYLAKLDGATPQNASRRVGDSPSSDAEA